MWARIAICELLAGNRHTRATACYISDELNDEEGATRVHARLCQVRDHLLFPNDSRSLCAEWKESDFHKSFHISAGVTIFCSLFHAGVTYEQMHQVSRRLICLHSGTLQESPRGYTRAARTNRDALVVCLGDVNRYRINTNTPKITGGSGTWTPT